MIPDELDKKIFWEFYLCSKLKSETNLREIIKKYLQEIQSITGKKQDVDSAYRCIKSRMNEYAQLGYFLKKFNGGRSPIWVMNLNHITFSKHKTSKGMEWFLLIKK